MNMVSIYDNSAGNASTFALFFSSPISNDASRFYAFEEILLRYIIDFIRRRKYCTDG